MSSKNNNKTPRTPTEMHDSGVPSKKNSNFFYAEGYLKKVSIKEKCFTFEGDSSYTFTDAENKKFDLFIECEDVYPYTLKKNESNRKVIDVLKTKKFGHSSRCLIAQCVVNKVKVGLVLNDTNLEQVVDIIIL